MIKRSIFVFLVFITLFSLHSSQVYAECQSEGQCELGQYCHCPSQIIKLYPGDPNYPPAYNGRPYYSCVSGWVLEGSCGGGDGREVIGPIRAPAPIRLLNAQVPDGDQSGRGNIGIIIFASNIITIVNIFAGIFMMFNFIIAGYTYITLAGNTSAYEKANQRILYGMIGLLIIVVSYSFAGLIGLVFFGDAGFILSPELTSALP